MPHQILQTERGLKGASLGQTVQSGAKVGHITGMDGIANLAHFKNDNRRRVWLQHTQIAQTPYV